MMFRYAYTDDKHLITPEYHEAKAAGTLAALPAPLVPHATELFKLVDSVFSASELPEIEDSRKVKTNQLNANFERKAFRELWKRIHTKAVYTVSFETGELIRKCVAALDADLKVAPLQYVIERGQQTPNDRLIAPDKARNLAMDIPDFLIFSIAGARSTSES
ncbi:MAG: hypothetical protein P4L40_18840 [Terracidiphilus sp.]|nr:hypothetical protein [Terracidiphilus sp.]